MKIAVGLSGGIDSSTAIIRLHEQGHDVIGISMKAFDHDQGYGKDTSAQDALDAKQLCQSLGLNHHVIDVQEDFYQIIINYFINDYLKGRTPNPCLFCNPEIKFKRLLEAAQNLGYDYLATGHYAIVEKHNDDVILKKGIDPLKDQAYFLSRLTPAILKQCIFPLGETLKKDNIVFLEQRNLAISEKRESHEICFVPTRDYTEFLKEKVGQKIIPGDILDESGKIVGEHSGIPYYTIGQRRGLNAAFGKPVYVRKLIPETNSIVIGEKPYDQSFTMSQVNWLANYDFSHPIPLTVKVRYFHEGEQSVITKIPDSEEYSVQLENPVFSITKGQGAVFYLDNKVICSGIIE